MCLVIAQGCKRQGQGFVDLRVVYEVSPQPPRVGPVTITVRIMPVTGKPVTGARVSLEGNMTHAGMVPVFAEAREIEPGRYVSTMELTMAGDWHVTIHVTLSNGRKLEHRFEITGVS